MGYQVCGRFISSISIVALASVAAVFTSTNFHLTQKNFYIIFYNISFFRSSWTPCTLYWRGAREFEQNRLVRCAKLRTRLY